MIKKMLKSYVTLAKQLVRRLYKREPVLEYVPVLSSTLLRGRVALITGGTRGIGFAIAAAFLRSGATVVITGRDPVRLDDAVRKLGAGASGFVLDNRDCAKFPDKIKELFLKVPKLDILVNNAGLTQEDVTLDKFDDIVSTNLKGAFFLSKAIAAEWVRGGKRANILNVCSTSGLRPGMSPYVFSKWGLRSMTLGMAKEYVSKNIVVNGIAPGPTSSNDAPVMLPSNPSGRRVTPQEVASLAVVLVSDLARMVVGDILYVGGGAGVITVDDV